MADTKKITELPLAGSVSDDDFIPVVQGSGTYKQVALNFKNYIKADTGSFAGSAAKLTTPRTFAITGDGSWSVEFDGSGNVTGALTLATVPVAKGGTGAVTALAARQNLGVRNVSTRFIEGLELTWGASSLSVSPGAAYVPSLSRVVESSAAIVVALSGLTTGTFYHLYLAETAGVAVVELSATAPLATATGGFIKTGDTSRRYIASVLANGATSVYQFVHLGNTIEYAVSVAGVSAFNFTGSATTATNVSVSSCVPSTGIQVSGDMLNTNTVAGQTLRIANSDIGTVTASFYRKLVLINCMSTADILLTSTQTFSYMFDVAPSTGYSLRVNGYKFRR